MTLIFLGHGHKATQETEGKLIVTVRYLKKENNDNNFPWYGIGLIIKYSHVLNQWVSHNQN